MFESLSLHVVLPAGTQHSLHTLQVRLQLTVNLRGKRRADERTLYCVHTNGKECYYVLKYVAWQLKIKPLSWGSKYQFYDYIDRVKDCSPVTCLAQMMALDTGGKSNLVHIL